MKLTKRFVYGGIRNTSGKLTDFTPPSPKLRFLENKIYGETKLEWDTQTVSLRLSTRKLFGFNLWVIKLVKK